MGELLSDTKLLLMQAESRRRHNASKRATILQIGASPQIEQEAPPEIKPQKLPPYEFYIHFEDRLERSG